MIKTIIILTLSALYLTACSKTATTATQTNQPATGDKDTSLIASSHSGQSNTNGENAPLPSKPDSPHGLPSNAGNSSAVPMGGGQGTAIDTSEFDVAIAKAEKALKSAPNDATAKKNLAEAYAKRGFALTEAAQYRSAIGDFRKSLKLNAANKEVQEMNDQILSIYQSMKREPPKEGEEPPPLPFKKEV